MAYNRRTRYRGEMDRLAEPVPSGPDGLHLPDWVSGRIGPGDAIAGAVAFRAAGALGSLHPLGMDRRPDVPMGLVRDHLAMRAAVGGMVMLGRPEREAELRDEVYALRPGERPGPRGAVLARWRRVVGTPLRGRRIADVVGADRVPASAGDGAGTPIDRAADALARARDASPGEPLAAVAVADMVLGRALGWPHALPLLGMGLRRADLRTDADGLRAACARAVLASARDVLSVAVRAARSRSRLLEVAPKLRARASDAALSVFLAQAAVMPALDLSPRVRGTSVAMSDSAARRLCDRLVSLGAATELTGRSWSRMYGL
jgi:hypothetical protein